MPHGETFFYIVIYMEEEELKPPKEPKDIEAQIGILKEHGCLISDKSFAKDVLSKVNYY